MIRGLRHWMRISGWLRPLYLKFCPSRTSEGLGLGIDSRDLGGIDDIERDAHGNVRIAEVNIGEILKAQVRQRLQVFGLETTMVVKNIGYELRCADPIPYDMDYTRDLGYCAARYLISGGNAAMISIQGGAFVPIPFGQMVDPDTGRTRVRLVDTESARYRIARRYMIRLRHDDFEDADEIARFAAICGLSLEEFRREFEHVVEDEQPPLVLDVERGFIADNGG